MGEVASRQDRERVTAIANQEAKGHALTIRWDIGIAVTRKPQEAPPPPVEERRLPETSPDEPKREGKSIAPLPRF